LRFATIEPKRVVLNGSVTVPLRQVVTIIPEERFAFTILKAETKEGTRNIDHRLESITHNGRAAYRLTLENRKTEAGRYAETVVLTTDSPIKPQLFIPVFGNIQAPSTANRPSPMPSEAKQ